jgi:hypothetical protein
MEILAEKVNTRKSVNLWYAIVCIKKIILVDRIEIDTKNRKQYECYQVLTYFLFIYLVCEAIGTAATPGLLC